MPVAEYNVARLRYPIDDPRSAGFADNLERINALGERAQGFVWRFDDDCRDPADQALHGDPLDVATLSVWADLESLRNFVHKTVHGRFYRQRAEWFEAMAEHHLVIWPVDEAHRPTLEEAKQRLWHRREHGDSDYAFGWNGPSGAAGPQAAQVLSGAGDAARGIAHG